MQRMVAGAELRNYWYKYSIDRKYSRTHIHHPAEWRNFEWSSPCSNWCSNVGCQYRNWSSVPSSAAADSRANNRAESHETGYQWFAEYWRCSHT